MKKLLFLATLMLAVMQASAANVDLATAQASAQRFLHMKPGKTLQAGAVPNVKLLHTEVNSSRADLPVYYIFNSDRGFVIVSGEDRAHEILAMGDRPLDMKRMPDNMRYWLGTYKAQIEYLQAHPGLEVKKDVPGKSLRAATVPPMLTAMWDQGTPYNNHCKFGSAQCLTGCPATSLAMVFYYWKYPIDATPPVEGYVNEASGYEFTIDALPPIIFEWDNMLDTYVSGSYNSAQADAVAWLMRYIGQEEHMEYAPGASGAMGADILRAVKFFGYDEESARLEFKTRTDDDGVDTAVYYTDDEWAAMLQNEMAEGRPVVYCGYDYDDWFGWSGHAFNVDGYDASTDKYHVNWGWSGEGNGDFALNAFDGGGSVYNIGQQMIMGIQPPPTGPTIKVSTGRINMDAYVDQSSTATFTVKGVDLTGDVTVTLNDESGYFSLDASHVAAADLEDGKVITVTYAPLASGNHTATVTLSNPAATDKVITINGTAVIDGHKPVMLPADSAHVNLTQFRADWTDQTADKYVSSYTLQVNTKPTTQLLAFCDFSDYPEQSGNHAGRADELIPEGWTFDGSGLWLDGASIELSSGSSITSPAYDLFGYEKVTVVVRFKSWSSWSLAHLTISTSKESQDFAASPSYVTYTAVLECGDTENIKFLGTNYPMIQKIWIYAGELEENTLRAVVDEGDATHREVTGITGKNYTVKGLEAGGTFNYRVKAVYTDGTESPWSNIQTITLFENGNVHQPGDVNHDGIVNVTDITLLISCVLNDGNDAVCDECGDVNGDGLINVTDVTLLINKVLGEM